MADQGQVKLLPIVDDIGIAVVIGFEEFERLRAAYVLQEVRNGLR